MAGGGERRADRGERRGQVEGVVALVGVMFAAGVTPNTCTAEKSCPLLTAAGRDQHHHSLARRLREQAHKLRRARGRRRAQKRPVVGVAP